MHEGTRPKPSSQGLDDHSSIDGLEEYAGHAEFVQTDRTG
jgi:hypothetical protein